MISSIDLEQADKIVTEYGKLLSHTQPSLYGIAASSLPYDKELIKLAIQTLLLSIDKDDRAIKDSLSQAYVFLAQFIDDERVAIAEAGRKILEEEAHTEQTELNRNTEDLELANQAVQTINGIKTEMENLMNEIRLLLA